VGKGEILTVDEKTRRDAKVSLQVFVTINNLNSIHLRNAEGAALELSAA
jgi:hypothetical protein